MGRGSVDDQRRWRRKTAWVGRMPFTTGGARRPSAQPPPWGSSGGLIMLASTWEERGKPGRSRVWPRAGECACGHGRVGRVGA